MKVLRLILVLILFAALQVGSAVAQQNVPLGENAALRYWSAFAEMQDSVITDQQAKELNAILVAKNLLAAHLRGRRLCATRGQSIPGTEMYAPKSPQPTRPGRSRLAVWCEAGI